MKNTLVKFLLFFTLIFIFESKIIYSQQVRMNSLAVSPSNIIEDLKKFKTDNPGASAEQLVNTANSLLDRQGFNYSFVFDENTCRAIAEARNKRKKSNEPLNLNAKLNSVAGEITSIVLPEERYEKSECGRCSVYLPVWEATEKDFVTFVQNINVKFYLPSNFTVNEIQLVSDKDLKTIVRRWKVPYRIAPLSITDDGKIIYLPLPDKELNDLVLMIYDEGVIQFEAKKEISSDKKGTILKNFPADAANPQASYISFGNSGIKQTLRYSAPCDN